MYVTGPNLQSPKKWGRTALLRVGRRPTNSEQLCHSAVLAAGDTDANLQNTENCRLTKLLGLRPPSNNSEELCPAAILVFVCFNQGTCASPTPICKPLPSVDRQSSSNESVPQTLLRSIVLRHFSGFSKQSHVYVAVSNLQCPKDL